MIKGWKRSIRLVVGCILTGVGAALSIPGVPGPGIAVLVLGLSVLSTDFEFARRLMERIKNLARRATSRGGERSAVS